MIVDIQQTRGNLNISFVDNKGEINMMPLKIPSEDMFNWTLCNPSQKPEVGITSWNGKPVRKTKTGYLTKFRIEEFLMKQPDYITDVLYEANLPKIFSCDIEVEVTDDGFPHPHIAKNAITSIAFCNGKKVFALGTKKLTASEIRNIEIKTNEHFKDFYEIEFKYIYFETEYDMLYSFLSKAMKKIPLLTGWNFIGFDWPYIVNRARKLNIDPEICSDSHALLTKAELPQHKIVVDYMQIYKTWDRTASVKESNGLDWVGQTVLGLNKIKYSGTLQELYEQDFEKYIFYNVVDTLLVQHIHEKIKTMNVFLTLATITKVEVRNAFSPIFMTESAICRDFYKRGQVFPKTDSNHKRESYEGAFVFNPIPGIYEWLGSFDFASLYPSIMRQWNISPESYIRNTKEKISDPKYIQTSTGAVFDNSKNSVFRNILTRYYGKRKEAKKRMFVIKGEIESLKEYIK